MAGLGGTAGIMEVESGGRKLLDMTGFRAWFAWRTAYLTRLHTVRNRLSLMSDWYVAPKFVTLYVMDSRVIRRGGDLYPVDLFSQHCIMTEVWMYPHDSKPSTFKILLILCSFAA